MDTDLLAFTYSELFYELSFRVTIFIIFYTVFLVPFRSCIANELSAQTVWAQVSSPIVSLIVLDYMQYYTELKSWVLLIIYSCLHKNI